MKILSSSFEAKCLAAEFSDFSANRSQAADLRPPSNNMGGTYLTPPTPSVVQKTRIDWLAFVSPVGVVALRAVVSCIFPSVVFTSRASGMYGYPESYDLTVDSVPVGILAHGAKHGRDYVSITGKGCQLIDPSMYWYVREVLHTVDAVLRRIDICLDFYRGELTIDQCLDAYSNGWFKLPKAPNMPMLSQVGSSREGVNFGRSLYIGSRKGSKMARIYEKGLEIFSRMPDDFREACTDPSDLVFGPDEHAPVGTIADQWLRVEVEYKAVDVELSLDIITTCDQYFAGSYPLCEQLLRVFDGVRPKRLKPSLDIDLEKMISACRTGYGSLVHSLSKVGYSDTDIKNALTNGKHNQRLVRSGVLSRLMDVPDFDIPF